MPATPPITGKMPDRTIVLVGLMGVGKSTVGRRLAARLGRPFFDADAEIEVAAGMTVAEIFEKFGETHFRDGERRVVARLMDGRSGVIATGGGAFADDATRALILERGLAVWLDADISTLVERVGRRDHRPLLRNRDAAEVLTELAGRRNAAYAEAPITVRSGRGSIEKTVDAIVAALTARD